MGSLGLLWVASSNKRRDPSTSSPKWHSAWPLMAMARVLLGSKSSARSAMLMARRNSLAGSADRPCTTCMMCHLASQAQGAATRLWRSATASSSCWLRCRSRGVERCMSVMPPSMSELLSSWGSGSTRLRCTSALSRAWAQALERRPMSSLCTCIRSIVAPPMRSAHTTSPSRVSASSAVMSTLSPKVA